MVKRFPALKEKKRARKQFSAKYVSEVVSYMLPKEGGKSNRIILTCSIP